MTSKICAISFLWKTKCETHKKEKLFMKLFFPFCENSWNFCEKTHKKEENFTKSYYFLWIFTKSLKIFVIFLFVKKIKVILSPFLWKNKTFCENSQTFVKISFLWIYFSQKISTKNFCEKSKILINLQKVLKISLFEKI